jgi:hypothetical protein
MEQQESKKHHKGHQYALKNGLREERMKTI